MLDEHRAIGRRRAPVPLEHVAPAGVVIRQRVGQRIIRLGVAPQELPEIPGARQRVGAGIEALLVRERLHVFGAGPLPRGLLLKLHQADFRGPPARPRMEIGFRARQPL